ncbi:MAG: chitin-binding domain-containing protein [Chloroflexota bacterium]
MSVAQVNEEGKSQPGPEPETGTISKYGYFQWIAPNGQSYSVSYLADEQGFVPQGAHLPEPPTQIPEYAQLRQDHPELFYAEQAE